MPCNVLSTYSPQDWAQHSRCTDEETEAQRGAIMTGVSVPGGHRGWKAVALSRWRVTLPYMLIPGMAGPRELGGGLMPLP